MILGVRDSSVLSASVAALKQAIANGTLPMKQIDESVTRIIALKIQYNLWPSTPMI
jgi:beta-glucosidase-like glycosyl hydrolase